MAKTLIDLTNISESSFSRQIQQHLSRDDYVIVRVHRKYEHYVHELLHEKCFVLNEITCDGSLIDMTFRSASAVAISIW